MSTALETQTMSERDARKLTERIRVTAHNYADARSKLQRYVTEAKEGKAHLALGYASWTAYLSELLGDEPMRLARGERQEMVQMLSAEGMSTRAIAPIVGVTQQAVAKSLRNSRDNQVVTSHEQSPETPSAVVGMDGKTYSRPEPQPEPAEPPKPRRRPITDQAAEAGWELRKATERLQRIFEDDRLGRNKEEVAAHLLGHLTYAAATLQDLIDTLNNN